jgi:hypothetical protein
MSQITGRWFIALTAQVIDGALQIDSVVLRTPGFSIGPLDTFALWSRGNVDPFIHRVLSLIKEIKRE